jgi:hypothetical protein
MSNGRISPESESNRLGPGCDERALAQALLKTYSVTSTDRQADDPQTLVLNENEKATLRRIAYARASGIKLDPFWLDFEAALTVSAASPDRNSK